MMMIMMMMMIIRQGRKRVLAAIRNSRFRWRHSA